MKPVHLTSILFIGGVTALAIGERQLRRGSLPPENVDSNGDIITEILNDYEDLAVASFERILEGLKEISQATGKLLGALLGGP
ncbi:hypothetical protein HDV62DRAFT_367913 [Trichoderma sp. SZMC 28011]